MIDPYLVHLLVLIGIYAILSISLQLSLGFTGLLNLGHIAFYAIGAYASALIVINGLPFWLGLLVAFCLVGVFGYLLSLPTKRLKGDYLALATLGFTYIVNAIAINWTAVTRGPLGLPNIPRSPFFGIDISDNINYLSLVWIGVVIIYILAKKITSSPYGKVMEAIRDDELAVQVLGKKSFKVKSQVLILSAAIAGLAGGLYAPYITYIDPASFTFSQMIVILIITIIGGLASLEGAIATAFIVILLPEPLRFLGLPSSLIGPSRLGIYALLILVLLALQPKGLMGKVDLK